MTWQDQQPPWGRPGRPGSPEELISEIIRKFKEKIKEKFSGGPVPPGAGGHGAGGQAAQGGSKPHRGNMLLLVVGGIILFQLITSTFYTIESGEQGVVLRFGRFSKTASSGLNFKVPLIDHVTKVDVETVRKEEFGFRTKKADRQTVYEKEGFDAESLMLTADKNVIDVEWIVQYKVRDPFNFVFKVEDVIPAVRDLSETAIRRIVGNMDFDYVLSNREVLAATTAKELQAALDTYESGVDIVTVQLQDVNPPNAVKPAFNEVNEADQDMKRLVNEAEEAYNQVVPKARGQAKELLEQSHGYAKERVNIAKGEAGRFLAVLKEYRVAKEVTRQRLYLETMQEVLPTLTDIYVLDKDQRGLLPFLNITGGSTPVAPQP